MAEDYSRGTVESGSGIMPFSPEAEQSVLGAILLDASCLDKVAEILPRAEYFYAVNNSRIYAAMLDMFTAGQPIDFVTVLEKLKEDNTFDEGSGKVYLMQLAQLVPSISNVESYAKIVRERYDVRMLLTAAREIIENVSDNSTDAELLLDSAEQKIFDIRSGKSVEGLQHIREIILDTYDRLDLLNSEDAEQYRAIPTGIASLDNVITGLNKSDLVILAARPGMGKTSFALNIARHVAVTKRKRVAFFSLEMGREQLVSRMLSTEALVEGTKLRTGALSETEWARIIEAGSILSGSELYIDDNSQITVNEMKAKLRRLKNVDLVFVDYLQLMGSGKAENRVQEISQITRNFKIMAKELNIPVVVLSQLARGSEKRTDHKPVLSDLRDSGSIEQDADIVLFLYREDYYQNENPDVEADRSNCLCIVGKNRHGETREVPLHWQGEYLRFTSREVFRDEG